MNKLRFLLITALVLFMGVAAAHADDSAFIAPALNHAVLRNLVNNGLNTRLGDLRRTEAAVASSVWARYFFSDVQRHGGLNLNAQISGFEAGYDFRIFPSALPRFFVGFFGGYLETQNFQTGRNATISAPLLGAYTAMIHPNGWFADIAARYYFSSDTDIFALSAQTGKEFKFASGEYNFFMVEPKLGATFGSIASQTAFIARPAVLAGYAVVLNNGAKVIPFLEFGFSRDFSSDMTAPGARRSISGDSFDFGGGVNIKVTNVISFYSYAGYESGDNLRNVSANMGVRIALGGVERGLRQCKATAPAPTQPAQPHLQHVPLAPAQPAQHVQAPPRVAVEVPTPTPMPAVVEPIGAIYFDFDRYNITPESANHLRTVADRINRENLRIILTGHTDRIGTGVYNQALSVRRARAVYNKLVEYGVAPQRLEYTGVGFNQPASTHYRLNRRVEFTIVR